MKKFVALVSISGKLFKPVRFVWKFLTFGFLVLLSVCPAAASQFELVPDVNGVWKNVDVSSFMNGLDPEFNAKRDVFFLLYTRRNPKVGQPFSSNSTVINESNFNATLPTRFIVHGWRNNFSSDVNLILIPAYLQNGDFNIVSRAFNF